MAETSILYSPRVEQPKTVSLLRALARLQSWFQTDFFIFDAVSSRVLHAPKSVPLVDHDRLWPLIRVVAEGGPARCLAGEGAVSIWAIRFECDSRHVVAVAPFLTDLAPIDWRDAQRVLLTDEGASQSWVQHKSIWPHRGLESFLQVAMQNLQAQAREDGLRDEVQGLAISLSQCFEELTLLHDLSRQLRLDTDPRCLGERVLSSLHGCLPARTMVAMWELNEDSFTVQIGVPVPENEINAARKLLTKSHRHEPSVMNYPGDHVHWSSRAIGVPILDNDLPIGMIMALGRNDAQEFGTTEANLLHSVAGVFGGFIANHRLYLQARELFQGAVQALTSAIDAKDPYTCGHSNRVARMSRLLAHYLDLSKEDVEAVFLSGLLHDVGKIGIDERVLKKPDRLTDEEFEHIKQHPDLGYRILVNVPAFKPFLPGVRHHHEAWDGSGYPCGLKGNEIPRQAQIIAVADSLDAMTSNRPYRNGMPMERVEKILLEGRGTQWAADVIDAYFVCRDELLEIIHEGNRVSPQTQSNVSLHADINANIMLSRPSLAQMQSG